MCRRQELKFTTWFRASPEPIPNFIEFSTRWRKAKWKALSKLIFNLICSQQNVILSSLQNLLIAQNWIMPWRWMILHNSHIISPRRIKLKILEKLWKILNGEFFGNFILWLTILLQPVQWNAIKCEITFSAGNHNSSDMMRRRILSSSLKIPLVAWGRQMIREMTWSRTEHKISTVDVLCDFTFFVYEFKFQNFSSHHAET